MKVITVTSDLDSLGFSKYLVPSCEFYKLNLVVLEYEGVFSSRRLKDVLLEEYLKNTDDDEIIFFTDGSDTVFVADENEILNKFYSFNSPLVFSAEVNCWPDKKFEKIYPQRSNRFKYLNSGGFIGKAAFIKKIYQKYPIFTTVYDTYKWSNQQYWNYVFINEFDNIKIDYDCAIFYNTAMQLNDIDDFKRRIRIHNEREVLIRSEKLRLDKEIVFGNKRLKSNITGLSPCHIHFPGPIAKKLLRLGYFKSLKHKTVTNSVRTIRYKMICDLDTNQNQLANISGISTDVSSRAENLN